jgi:hypothetical protein
MSDRGAFSDHHICKHFYFMRDGSTKILAAFIVMQMWFECEVEVYGAHAQNSTTRVII